MCADPQEPGSAVLPDKKYLLELARARMPYGRHAGRLLVDLPETYIVWLSQAGFPRGKLGDQLRCVYEIKLNGLEYLFKPLKAAKASDGNIRDHE